MIDLSCHFLYGPDCGPASFAESLELCRAAGRKGVRTIVMTPRWKADCGEPPLPFVKCVERIDRLQQALDAGTQLKFGFVLPYSAKLPQLVDRHGSAVALGGSRHLLVSLPANSVPAAADDVWADLSAKGFVIVISQPESRPALRRQAEKVRAWVGRSVKLQVSAASVLGWHGRDVKRAALEYIETYGDSVLVASNGHLGNGGIPSLEEAREEISKTFGERQAAVCLQELPGAILANEPLKKLKTSLRLTERFPFLRAFMS